MIRVPQALAWLILLSTCLGCDGDRSAALPGSGVLTFDAAAFPSRDAGRAVDASVVDAGDSPRIEPDAGPIGRSSDGVLTNEPEVRFVNRGRDIVITTAAFRMFQRDDGTWTFWWGGHYENQGTNTLCIPDFDVLFDGRDVLTVAHAESYLIDNSFGASRFGCVAPGEEGIYWGIENDMPSDFASTIGTIFYTGSALIRNEALPDPARARVVRSEIRPNEDGELAVYSTWSTSGTAIYNFSAEFYPRVGGLIWGALTVYHLDDVPALTEFEPEVFRGHDGLYEELEVRHDFLVRRDTGLVDVDHPDFAALSEWRSRRTRARDALERR